MAGQAAEGKAARFAAVTRPAARSTPPWPGGPWPVARRLAVEATTIGGREDALPTGFNYTAPANLVLFVFITSVAGAAGLIEAATSR